MLWEAIVGNVVAFDAERVLDDLGSLVAIIATFTLSMKVCFPLSFTKD